MGMAEEVKQAQQPKAEVPAPAVDVEGVTEILTQGMPKADVSKQEAPVEPIVEAPKTEIKIGDKVFTSEREALEYAQELERGMATQDAYQRGIEAALRSGQEPTVEIDPVTQFATNLGDKLFENPAEAIAQIVKFAKESTSKEIEQSSALQREREAVFNKFYADNPDLANHRDLYQMVLEKSLPEVGSMDAAKGLNVVADKVRKLLKGYAEAQKPQVELHSGRAETSGVSGGPAPIATPQNTTQDLDFIAQVNKLRRRGKATL